MAFVLAQYITDSTAVDVLDDGDVGAILSNLNTALLTTVRGRLLNIQTFSSSGTYTKTAGARFNRIKVWGGGEGGTKTGTSIYYDPSKGADGYVIIEAYA
jgi:hypothetical protein